MFSLSFILVGDLFFPFLSHLKKQLLSHLPGSLPKEHWQSNYNFKVPFAILEHNYNFGKQNQIFDSVNNPFSLKYIPRALLSHYKVFKGLPTSELQLVRLGHSDMVAQSTLEIRKS